MRTTLSSTIHLDAEAAIAEYRDDLTNVADLARTTEPYVAADQATGIVTLLPGLWLDHTDDRDVLLRVQVYYGGPSFEGDRRTPLMAADRVEALLDAVEHWWTATDALTDSIEWMTEMGEGQQEIKDACRERRNALEMTSAILSELPPNAITQNSDAF